MAYQLKYKVVRHEIGHNFGHPHHRSMLGYRNDPSCECSLLDKFDMMSGGNSYKVSHFPIASKWFFNWVPDSAITMVQPEGATDECPDCRKEGTFQIFTSDKFSAPPQADQIMGIQIPIMGHKSTIYSYWLSYRSGNDGDAAGGLSVHLGWFSLGGMFGASYDSLRYDAHGNTETMFDSFVLPGTCYIIEPALKLMDIDPFAAKQVIPQVCVDALNTGSDITVSVSFLDPNDLYTKTPDQELICSLDGQASLKLNVNSSLLPLIHVSGAGSDGVISSNLCSSNVTGYIYDNYPYATLDAGAPLAYGSFPGFNGDNCIAKTQFGEAWLLLESNETNEVEIEIGCQMTSCLQNQYKSTNICTQCPDNHIAPTGSTDISDCTKCPDGLILTDPTAQECTISEEFDTSIETSSGWRIWAQAPDHTVNWQAVAVKNMKMYSASDCSGNEIVINGTFVESGNAGSGFGPEKAFQTSGQWGGRRDENKQFYLGVIFNNDVTVRCMRILFTKNYMEELRVQALVDSEWENVWIERNVTGEVENEISWGKVQEAAPSTVPSFVPTFKPAPQSTAPSFVPSIIPSYYPSYAPITLPTRAPIPDLSSSSPSPTSEPDPVLIVTVPCVFKISNVTLPEDPEERDSIVQVLEQTISEMLGAGESLDVIVRAINGIVINSKTINARTAVAFNQIDDANIEFDIVEEIVCEGTCADDIESVGSVASENTQLLTESLSSGSFMASLTANAASSGVAALENASVNVEDFSSEEPKVEIVTPSPTFSPSLAPTLSSSTEPSILFSQPDSILSLFLELLRRILEVLISALSK